MHGLLRGALFVASSGFLVVACGGSSGSDGSGGGTSTGGGTSGDGGTGSSGDGGTGSTGTTGGNDASLGGLGDDSGTVTPPPASLVCTAPISAADVSHPTTTVGTGAGTCTEAALTTAIAAGGTIVFDCGGATTIPITATLELPKGKDTVIDGGGTVTLDGGGAVRLLHFDGGDFRKTTTTITLQHLTLTNAKSSGTMLPTAPSPCSQGYDTDAGGGAVLINDGILHVVDVTFTHDNTPSPGPDLAGGAIYATGSLGLVVVGSTFDQNSGSNGGAIGSLNSDVNIVNSVFTNNQATGNGANTIDTAHCSVRGGEVGNGGNGGAMSMDGGSDGTALFCGDVFKNNKSGVGGLGGALGRTPDIAMQTTQIDQSLFDGNQGDAAGAMYFHNSKLVITASTISNNSSSGSAIQADGTELDFTNVTLANNEAKTAPGGAISLFGNGGTLTNCTFAGNKASGGSGVGFAADLFGGTTLTINNTVFASAVSSDGGSAMSCQAMSNGGGDLQWPTMKTLGGDDPACVTGITFADPMLGALGDNGGPTPTMLPGAAATVVNVGTACPATDQRGMARPSTGCTAGAVQLP